MGRVFEKESTTIVIIPVKMNVRMIFSLLQVSTILPPRVRPSDKHYRNSGKEVSWVFYTALNCIQREKGHESTPDNRMQETCYSRSNDLPLKKKGTVS